MKTTIPKGATMIRIACLSLPIALFFVGCKPESEGQTVQPGGAAALGNPPGDMPNDVPVGVLLPFTGDWAWVGAAESGIKLATHDINEVGHGVQGKDGVTRPVKFYVEDTATDSKTAIAAARKLLNVHHVLAIVGPTSAEIHAVIPVAKEAGAVILSPTAGTTSLDQMGGCIADECVFRTVSSDIVMGSGMAWYAANVLKARRAALFFADNEGARSISGVLDYTGPLAGLEKVDSIVFPSGQGAYRSELEELAKSKPDVVFFEAPPDTAAVFLRQAFELGIKAKWVGTDFVNDDLLRAAGEAVNGVIGVRPEPAPGTRLDAWKSEYTKLTGNEDVKPFATNAYDAAILVALSLERSGRLDRSAVRLGLRDVASPPGTKCETFVACAELIRKGDDVDYDGIAGSMDFNEFGSVVTPLSVSAVGDGKLRYERSIGTSEIGDMVSATVSARAKPK